MNIVVALDKDNGITSHDAVHAVKKLFKVKKAGHAGTLDPMATGLLLVCLNEATKITGFLSSLDKEYVVTAKLGESTDTYDAEGRTTKKVGDFSISKDLIEEVIKKFRGEIEQVPPMYSAIKLCGKPLYALARKGIEVERAPRTVTISSMEIISFESPFLRMKVSCSKGTYIRSLCNDIGDALGVGAHITELIRTRIGDFSIENSAKINELPHKPGVLYSIDSALKHLPDVVLDGEALKRLKNGNPVALQSEGVRFQGDAAVFSQAKFVRLKDREGRVFGVGKASKEIIKTERLFN